MWLEIAYIIAYIQRGGEGEGRLTEYVFELSGECPSFRGRGWVHGL